MFDDSRRSRNSNEDFEHPDASRLVMRLLRLGVVCAFVLLVGRLFQLQIVQGEEYRGNADANRFRLEEVAAPRGVIYDKTGQILVRNRPSFEISVVPDDIPLDDLDTGIDETAAEIERILDLLDANGDDEIAVRIGELMFRRLGRVDFAETVEDVGVDLEYVLVTGPTELVTPADGGEPFEVTNPVLIPDISNPLPMTGLVALVKRAVELGRQGSASEPVPILDLVERIPAFEIVEESYRMPSVRVREVPVREYIYGELLSHVLGFMGPIPAALEDDYRANGYSNPNERVGLSGLEYAYQTELRGLPGFTNMEVDILGREMRTVGQVIEPVPGYNLILNLDRRLQEVMSQ